MYNQGDIILIPFPYSDLSASKLRPALILSNSKLNVTQDRICCLITSVNVARNGLKIPSNAIVSNALPFDSWVKPQRIFTVDQNIIRKKISSVTDDFLTVVRNDLQTFID